MVGSPTDRQVIMLLESLGRILSTSRDWQRAAMVFTRFRDRLRLIYEVARKNKVLPVVHRNLSELNCRYPGCVSPEFLDELSTIIEKHLEHQQRCQTEMLKVVSDLNREAGVEVMLLKGYSVQRLYPAPYRRWGNDIDLMLRDASSALTAYEYLSDNGYVHQEVELPWFKQHRGQLYGQIPMLKQYADNALIFDIHYAHYSVGYCGLLEEDLWANSICTQVAGVTFRTLTPEGCFLLIFAHMLSQGYVRMKDINDAVAILLSAELDWAKLASTAKFNQLSPPMLKVLTTIRRLYDDPIVQERVGKALNYLGPRHHEQAWPLYRQSWVRRAILNSSYTFHWERQHNGVSRFSALRTAISCSIYYIRRFRVGIRNRKLWETLASTTQPKPVLLKGDVNEKTCVRLVPIEGWTGILPLHALEHKHKVYCPGKMLYIESSNTHLVITNKHAYIPTIDYIVEPDRLEAAWHLLNQWRVIEELRV